jgi:predicted MFS family arabinose efflux permease
MTQLTPAIATRSGYKWWVVAMLWLISFFNYDDRQAILSVFPLLQREMDLSTVQLGLLGSAFAWVYGLGALFAGMVIGLIAERESPCYGVQIVPAMYRSGEVASL